MRGANESAGPLRGRRGVLDKTHEPFREPFSFSYRLRAFRRSSPWTGSRPPWTAWWPPWTASRPTFFDPDFRPIFGRRFLSILNDFCLPFGLQNRPEITENRSFLCIFCKRTIFSILFRFLSVSGTSEPQKSMLLHYKTNDFRKSPFSLAEPFRVDF